MPECPEKERSQAGAPRWGSPAVSRFFVGVAGWSIPKDQAALYPAAGSHLVRYATALPCAEINSSFYRHHLPTTYARWGESVPRDFRFAVKLARAFTHEARLAPPPSEVKACLEEIRHLREKFGVLLVQLPPSLAFERTRAEDFFRLLRDHCPAPIAWEPRHVSWAGEEALALLERYGVAKVIADPEPCPAPHGIASDRRLRYYRLHGTPEIYRSRYKAPYLRNLATDMARAPSAAVWCIFDNTTFGFAHGNAHELRANLDRITQARAG